MIYFDALKDLQLVTEFSRSVKELRNIELKAADSIRDRYSFVNKDFHETVIAKAVHLDSRYSEIRSRIAEDKNEITSIAQRLGCHYLLTSYPAPAVGGPVLNINLFNAILNPPPGRSVSYSMILDALNELRGACVRRVLRERRKLINPIYWIVALLAFVLRIPFLIVSATGFNVAKIEDHLFGKLFKFILFVVILLLLLMLGFTKKEILEFIGWGG